MTQIRYLPIPTLRQEGASVAVDDGASLTSMSHPSPDGEPDVAPLLPPDPDAEGSWHWLQAEDGRVFPVEWRGNSWEGFTEIWYPDEATEKGLRYHSPLAVPAPLPAPDADADRLWAATVAAARP